MLKCVGCSLLLSLLATGAVQAADRRPMTLDDLFALRRVSSPQLSPDGRWVVYTVTEVHLADNRLTTSLWLAATDGSVPPRRLTTPPAGKKDSNPRWSPDGRLILFESNREEGSQLWLISPDGGAPRRLTQISTGASDPVWSPDGRHIAFVSAVYPEFSTLPFAESDRRNKAREQARESNPVKARVFTRLFFRHWDSYVEDKRLHLFVCRADGSHCRDVTPGDRDAFPTSTTFSSVQDFTFTPDGQHLIFTAVPAQHEAWSTNYDLCRVRIDNTSTEWETLTKGNPAADSGPMISPDGKHLAWRAQKRAGYEADQWHIYVAEIQADGRLTGPIRCVSANIPHSVDEFLFAPDGGFFYVAEDYAESAYFHLSPKGQWKRLAPRGIGKVSSLSVSKDPVQFVYLRASMTQPAEVWITRSDGKSVDLSRVNADHLARLDLPRPESVEVAVEGGVRMQMWLLKPPGFDPQKKWPVAYLVHGGPQGAWEDGWSWRWNPSLWAAQGYIVALPNPRGSTGFGQKFTDEISGDWGGKCYRDLVAGLEYIKKLPYVDASRLAAAGASFGGYMMNWFAVNDIAQDLKCIITHCSVWNFESMWGTTDELWFDEYEHGGLPWEVPGKYAEFSPHKKAGNLARYKVPMLVIHNDLDFRCPIGQGHELFTALQRLGVPSRMVNFPDEGHWVLKPRNSHYWHEEVFAWLKKYCPPGGR
ncbi:MAG: S9 family peptidase [Gemmataceae bacterium]|nr:S9 family peptidase [Gemmataceae bacterium]